MAFAQITSLVLLVASGIELTLAQGSNSATPSASTPADSSITSSADSASVTDRPKYLWSIADELLSSYYPSTSISQVSTLTWPDTVVIGGTTYNMQSLSDAIATSPPTSSQTADPIPTSADLPPSTTPTGSAAIDEEGSDRPNRAGGSMTDKKLGIIIGSVMGLVALALLCVLFCCLKRRKDDTGSFFMRRGRSPSIASSNIRSWLPSSRQDTYGNTTYVSAGSANPDAWEKQGPQVSVRPQMAEPRMSQHPAFAPAHVPDRSSRSTSEDNPFYTPAERMDAQLGYGPDLERGPYDPHPIELDDNGQPRPRSSHSIHAAGDRPPTPFSPMEMMGFGASRAAPPSQQVERKDFGENPALGQQHQPTNPFASAEDDEQDDLVSPILPSRSPERRHSPMVHYPSWSEVSEFDFQGDGNGRRGLRNVSSTETDGGDGWRPLRERTDGRYELA